MVSLKYKTSELPSEKCGEYNLPALTAGIQNQGLNNFVPRKNATILKNAITISANGANTGATFYQSKEFTVLQDSYALEWIGTQQKPTDKQYLFIVSTISKAIYGHYEWTNKAGWERIKNEKIYLPTKNGEIDFEFMESFVTEFEVERIAKLSDYLSVSELDNYELSKKKRKSIGKL